QLIREIDRPARELLIFSGEKGILMDFKIGERVYSWNENFPPEQISFSIDPNRTAHHRPQAPRSASTIDSAGVRWFPGHDFRFDPPERKFVWGKEKPVRVERLSGVVAMKLELSDSLIANNGAFRVVF